MIITIYMNKIELLPIDYTNVKPESIPEYPIIGEYDFEAVPTYSELEKDSKSKQIIDLIYEYINIQPVSNYEIFCCNYEHITNKRPRNDMFSQIGWYDCSRNYSAYDYESVSGLIFHQIPESVNLTLEYGHLINSPIKKKWYNLCGSSTQKVYITDDSKKITAGRLYLIPEYQRFRIRSEQPITKLVTFSLTSIQTRQRRPFNNEYWHEPNQSYVHAGDTFTISHLCKY